MASLFTEDFKTDPYWWEDVHNMALAGAALPSAADVVVIGSGYTGLNAALQTVRGGRSTLVLDAESAGWGCSTRNGGQISTSIKLTYDQLATRFNRRRASAILEEGNNALTWIERFVEGENIDCNFSVCGRFHGAHNPAAYKKLGNTLRTRTRGSRLEAHLVSRSDQRSELGTDTYHGGIVFPNHASLHPARYHTGLLRRAREAGVSIHAHCPVSAIEKQGAGFRVISPNGSVTAGNVVVASNGYTGSITPWQRRRVIPIGSYMIATEPLADGVIDTLMPRNRICSDTRRMVYYYRPSPDRSRILFGGRVSHDETDTRQSGALLHRELQAIFPELAGARVSHSWMGFVAYTFDTLAHIGKHNGIHYAMGYCGSGVSVASYLGMRIGQQVLGDPEGKTGFDGLKFSTRPLYTGDPWFLPYAIRYYKWRDRHSF